MKKCLSALLILCMLLSLLPAGVLAASGVLEITVPKDVTVTLKNAYGGTGSTITCDSRQTSGDYRTYVFGELSTGSYSAVITGTGYYEYRKDIYYEEGSTVSTSFTPVKRSGNGWESSICIEPSDLAKESVFLSHKDAWPGYSHIFDTPAFTLHQKNAQTFTTNDEMITYLRELLPLCKNMYYFNIGSSGSFRLEMPMVVFTKTDLSGMTMEEAGAAVRGNGKATVLHQAQIHGNEPAAGEGSLALAGALARGDLKDAQGGDILDSLNILIIPRINPDGSKNFTRNNARDGINMNRDYLVVRSAEVEAVLNAYNIFLPEVAIDAHEWTPTNSTESGAMDDLQLWASGSLNNASGRLSTSVEMMETVFGAAQKQGIRPYFYQGNMTYGPGNNSIGPWYYGLRGTFGFCVETRGIGIGRASFERRVFAQYIASESFLQYAAAHSRELCSAVAAERERIATLGKTYDKNELLVLEHGSTSYGKAYNRPTVNLNSGKITKPNATATPAIYSSATQTRSRPTAYILKPGTQNLSIVLQTLDKHDIDYFCLDQDTSITVRSYSGDGKSATLGSQQTVRFSAGTYILPMDQVGGNVLAMLMEPDVGDTASSSEALSTFVQKKTLSASHIYRYEGALDQIRSEETYTVSFLDESGVLLWEGQFRANEAPVYRGSQPTKAPTHTQHFHFTGWVNEDGEAVELETLREDARLQAAFYGEDHTFDTEATTQPNCTCAGSTKYSCQGCDYSYEEAISPLGHSPVIQNAKEPSCSAHGYSGDRVCGVCGVLLSTGSVLPPTDHSPEAVPGKEATCLGSGLTEGQICSVCGSLLVPQQVIPRLGHSYTYTDNGNGTHSGTCIRCEKTLNPEAHSYDEEGLCHLCSCARPLTDINIFHSLNLHSDIAINYVVYASALEGYDSFRLECRVPQYEGNRLIGYLTAELEPTLRGSLYYFTLDGLTAVNMNDTVEALLLLSKDGREFRSETDHYSISSYAYSKLNQEDADPKLQALCAELLRYGSAAQVYKNYRTDTLADGTMTDAHRSLLTDLDAVTFGNHNMEHSAPEDATIFWLGKTLDLASKVSIKYVFDTSQYTGKIEDLSLRVRYVDHSGESHSYELTEIEHYSGSYYSFDFRELPAADLRQVVQVAVYQGDTQLSSLLEYSADTYGNNKTGTLLSLCKSLFSYSDSALSFFQ